jgi:hypothetical protein
MCVVGVVVCLLTQITTKHGLSQALLMSVGVLYPFMYDSIEFMLCMNVLLFTHVWLHQRLGESERERETHGNHNMMLKHCESQICSARNADSQARDCFY